MIKTTLHRIQDGVKMLRNTILISLVAIGCSEQKFHSINGADGVRGPAIQVDPGYLEFGTLREGEEEIKSFMIASVGEEALQVEHVRIDSDAPSFTILTDVEGLRLPVGETIEVDVAFSAMAAHEQFGQAIEFQVQRFERRLPRGREFRYG